MKSAIVEQLVPEFEPVALVWSDNAPDGAIEFKEGRFGCVLNLFAEASRRGRVAGGSRDTIVCTGGRAALGLGAEIYESEERLEHCAAIYSKGLESAPDREAYSNTMEAARPAWRPLYQFGERRHRSFDKARLWILNSMPRYEASTRYVWFKPLSRTDPEDDVRAVIFPADPIELSGLITLLGSVVDDADPVHIPQGPDCFRVSGFAVAPKDDEPSRAVLGMLDVDGRELMRRRFRDDILTLTIPASQFLLMERESVDSVLQTPGWSKLRHRDH